MLTAAGAAAATGARVFTASSSQGLLYALRDALHGRRLACAAGAGQRVARAGGADHARTRPQRRAGGARHRLSADSRRDLPGGARLDAHGLSPRGARRCAAARRWSTSTASTCPSPASRSRCPTQTRCATSCRRTCRRTRASPRRTPWRRASPCSAAAATRSSSTRCSAPPRRRSAVHEAVAAEFLRTLRALLRCGRRLPARRRRLGHRHVELVQHRRQGGGGAPARSAARRSACCGLRLIRPFPHAGDRSGC